MSVADVKTAYQMITVYHAPLVGNGMGAVIKGKSLNPYQDWTGQVQLSFMEDMQSQEVFDASIEQFTAPGGIDAWMRDSHGSWTPWGLQFAAIECGNQAGIFDPTANEWDSMDINAIAVRQYCSSPAR